MPVGIINDFGVGEDIMAGIATITVGEIAQAHFTVFGLMDGFTPKTGVLGEMSTELFYENSISPVPVVLTEIAGTGTYFASFQPDAAGVWALKIDVECTKDSFMCRYAVKSIDMESLLTKICEIDQKTGDIVTILGIPCGPSIAEDVCSLIGDALKPSAVECS